MRPLLGATRRLLERLCDRIGDAAYRRPDDRTLPRLPHWFAPAPRLVGRLLLECRLPRRAQWCFELAAQADPGDATNHLLLGRSLLAGGAEGPVRSVTLDVVRGPMGDAEAAVPPLELAHGLQPQSAATAVELARAYHRSGDTARGLDVLADAPPGAQTLRARADIIDDVGRRRGAHRQAESDQIVDLRTRSLAERHDPSNRHRLVRHLVLQADFDDAFRAAGGAPEVRFGRRWRDVVDDDTHVRAVSDDWLYVAAATALDAGRVADVRRIKRTIAGRVVERNLPAVAPASVVIERVRARSYLSGETDAIAELVGRRARSATRAERLAFDKVDADLHLALGDVERLKAVRDRLATVNPEAEHRFRALVRGARIVVVGPADFGVFSPDELDRFDVIVSTKRPVTSSQARPTISYRSDANVGYDLLPALECGDGDHATIEVVRPSRIVPGARIPDHPSLRVMSAEDANTFLGTRFGIQRILYDLVGRGAAGIWLAGVNFYLSETPYVAGYDDEITRIYTANQLQPIRSRAPHDHGWDFRLTKLLADHGLIQAHPHVARLLELSVDEYLDQLTEIASHRPRESQLAR